MSDSLSSGEKPPTVLYKDTITGLNREYDHLLHFYLIGDCRTIYLKKFEMWLSLNCPDSSIWVNPRYMRVSKHYPLPKNVEQFVSRDLFYLYLMLYEMIMRDIGLIGRKKSESKNVKMFDMRE